MNQAYLDIIKKNNRTLNKANEIMSDIQQAVAYNDENSVYDLSLDYERTVERLVPLSRDLVICQGRKGSEQVVKQAIQENAPVEINFTKEGWLVLSIPALLQRKETHNIFVKSCMTHFPNIARIRIYKDSVNVFLSTSISMTIVSRKENGEITIT